MADLLADTPQPIWVVNGYLWEEIVERLKAAYIASYKQKYPDISEENIPEWTNPYGKSRPIFPINDSQVNAKWKTLPYLVYTLAFRVWHGLYVTKRSTFIYSLKASPDQIFGWGAAIQDILDRQDDAAADINEWNRQHDNVPVVFHSFRVYQNEPPNPSASSIDPFVSTNFMVVAEYHLV